MTAAVSNLAVSTYVSLEDYFEREEHHARHEWCDGAVFGMSGGTPRHSRLGSKMGTLLEIAIGNECEIFNSDLPIFIEKAKLSTYADVTVVCGELETKMVSKNDLQLGEAVTNPTIIVELLSTSTERYDRDSKYKAYRQLPSLEEYVLVSQYEPRVEVFRKKADGTWFAAEVGEPGGTVTLHGAKIAIDDLYAKIRFTPSR